MLSDTPHPNLPPSNGEGAHRCPEVSPIQAIPHLQRLRATSVSYLSSSWLPKIGVFSTCYDVIRVMRRWSSHEMLSEDARFSRHPSIRATKKARTH